MFISKCLYLHPEHLILLLMDIRKIDNGDLPLFWYVHRIVTASASKNKALIVILESVNDAIESIKNKPANLENCTQLKSFLVFEKAEITSKGLQGADVDELMSEIDNIIATLDTGVALGEKQQMYHSGGSQVFRAYDWYNEQHNWDTQTMEGYLKSHYREFSVPTYTFRDFMNSGYFKHCLIHNWDARETAETFCRLYNK